MLKLIKILFVGVTFSHTWVGLSKADTPNLCRYSISNLAENHCVNTSVKSYQDDFIASLQTSDLGDKRSLQDQWDWCKMNNLLNLVECTFLISPDLEFMQTQIDKEISRLINDGGLSEAVKRELLESEIAFQKRTDDKCSIPEQSLNNSEWDERIAYGDEVCRLANHAVRLMFLSNQYENP